MDLLSRSLRIAIATRKAPEVAVKQTGEFEEGFLRLTCPTIA